MTNEFPGIEYAQDTKAKPSTDTKAEDKIPTEETVLRGEEQKRIDELNKVFKEWMRASEMLKQARARNDEKGIALYEQLERTYHGLTDAWRLQIREFNKQLVAAGLTPRIYHEKST